MDLQLLEYFITMLFLGNGYLQSDLDGGLYDTALLYGLDRIFGIFTNKSGLSNGAIPLILSIIPYFLAIL